MGNFLTVLCIQILCGMEIDLFIPSFPELQRVFNLSPAQIQMSISVNFFAFCVCALFAGSLGDRYDRRLVLLNGFAIFIIGSLCCTFAANYFLLLLGRVLQGVGIAAPAILSFPFLLENYEQAKQPQVMGLINGAKTLAMAIAPVIGSFINLLGGWRANFVLLLGGGIFCWLMSYCFISPRKGDKTLLLSLRAYEPLLQSKQFLLLLTGLGLLTAAYWLFMGMAPLLYMGSLGVSLKDFGYYQGILSLTFAITCIGSPFIYAKWGKINVLLGAMTVCFGVAMFILALALYGVEKPRLITAALIILSAGIVFPINILYPLTLDLIPTAKGRAAGLGQCVVLLFTALLLEGVAFIYNGNFFSIGLTMFASIILALKLLQISLKNLKLAV